MYQGSDFSEFSPSTRLADASASSHLNGTTRLPPAIRCARGFAPRPRPPPCTSLSLSLYTLYTIYTLCTRCSRTPSLVGRQRRRYSPCKSTVTADEVECNMGVVWVQTPAAGVRTYGDTMAEQQLAKAQVLKSEFYTKYIGALTF